MKRTNLIIWFCIALLAGTYVGRYENFVEIVLLFAAGSFLLIRKRRYKYLFVCLCAGFAVGNYRAALQNSQYEHLRSYFETKTNISVQSMDDAEYDSRKQLAFTANNVILEDGTHVPAQILVSGFGEFSVLRGDRVTVVGKLNSSRGSSQARMSFAQLNVVEEDHSWYNSLRRTFNKKLRDNLPEPEASFASGLLIGQRSTIPQDVVDMLRVTGLAHIVAVSGYNLTIIIRFIMRVLRPMTRYQKLVLCVATLGVFVLITGFSASIVRASMVSVLSLLAWYHGRVFRPAVLLLLVAAGSALYKPEYVWGDVGWYLSFLAFGGIMILSPVIKQRLFKDRKPKFVGAIFCETSAVLVMVVPYSMYIFGTFSLIALPANIIIAPLIPLAMGLSVFASIIPYQLAFLAIPANLFLTGILEFTKLLSTIPHASISVRISFFEVVATYAFVTMIVFLTWNRKKRRIESSFLV